MQTIPANQLLAGLTLAEPVAIRAVVTDSRKVEPGCVFVCFPGERVDGHDYAAGAYRSGAEYIVANHPVEGVPADRTVIVPDSGKAMIRMASNYRMLFNPRMIGVTGSVGKTTTKEFCYAVLSAFGKTLKTEGNQNNDIGVPNTLFRLTDDTEYAVVEMGMDHAGEIERLTRCARPSAGIITMIGVSHLENLGTRENILKAKMEICTGLPDGAPLVIVLHGYGGQGDPERFDMNRVADRHGFAVCYPQGERDGRGKTCWNVGYPFQADMAVDDVRFLSELIRHLQKKHGLSRRNVFCTGMSNGGDMCYLLASRCPETYAALGPVAGFMSVEILRSDRNPHPIPLFEIHGTEDRTTRWEGDLGNEGGWGAYVSVPTAVGYWAAKNKCLAERVDTLPSRPGGLQVIAHRYTEGTDGNEVWLYETVGGKHSWKETGVDTGEELWKFFSRYVR